MSIGLENNLLMTVKKHTERNSNGSTGDPLREVLSRLEKVTGNSGQYEARCPCHIDNRNSLCIGTGNDGRVLLKCQAGCNNEDIVNALGLKWKDLFPLNSNSNNKLNGKPKTIAVYRYEDEDGNLQYEVHRNEQKGFSQCRPDGKGGTIWNMNGVVRVPYRLPELVASDPRQTVFICEGEKDCDRLQSLGILATCNSGGAGKWQNKFSRHFTGRLVVVITDNDDPGRDHAQKVAQSLHDVAESVRILELPNLPEKGDVSDWLDADGTKDGLLDLAESVSLWSPDPSVGFVSTPQGESEIPFSDPEPLPNELPPVRMFDANLLPDPFVDWISDISNRMQCPPDISAVAAMVGLSGILGRKVGIRPKRKDDWLVVSNLWAMPVARPGLMKTGSIQEPLKPIKRMEIEAMERHQAQQKKFEASELVSKVRRKDLEKDIRAAIKEGKDPDNVALAAISEEIANPARRRYLVNDSTVEKLGEILRDNPNGVTVYRDELSGLLRSLDKEEHQEARAFYLEAWNGNGRYTYDRIGRGTIDIEAAIVSVIGGIQPGPLQNYLKGVIKSNGTDDGLMQRFQLAVWPDVPKKWKNVDQWPDTVAKNRAYKVFRRLDALDPLSIGAETDSMDPDGIPFLRFTADAQDLFDRWRTKLESSLREDDDHPAIESHLSKYRSLIPSLALLIHLAESDGGPVSLRALQKAVGWGEYLESHARRIYASAVNFDVTTARLLTKKILRGDIKDGFALRDIYRKGWSGLSEREDVRAGALLLCDIGWLAETREQTPGATRTRYRINPIILKCPSDPTDKTDKSLSDPLLSVMSVPTRGHSEVFSQPESEPEEAEFVEF